MRTPLPPGGGSCSEKSQRYTFARKCMHLSPTGPWAARYYRYLPGCWTNPKNKCPKIQNFAIFEFFDLVADCDGFLRIDHYFYDVLVQKNISLWNSDCFWYLLERNPPDCSIVVLRAQNGKNTENHCGISGMVRSIMRHSRKILSLRTLYLVPMNRVWYFLWSVTTPASLQNRRKMRKFGQILLQNDL